MANAATDPVAPRVRARFEVLVRQAPEAGAWLGLVDAVLREAAGGSWAAARVVAGPRSAGAPVLSGARVTVPRAVVGPWVRGLLGVAGDRGGPGLAALRRHAALESVEADGLLQAAIRMDAALVAAFARRAGVDTQAFAQVAHLAAVPLLLALRAAGAFPPLTSWRSGPCPACGAFALLAESRGLAREHRLRCGRCGADGAGAELTCAFCGNADHERLRFLAPDGNPQARRVLGCLACHGYLRVIPTLEPVAPAALLLEDLSHVDLDLVGLEHQYARPAPPVLADLLLDARDVP
jgi:FdhE protein